MEFQIVFDREEDGRWIAEIESLPGVLAYGTTRTEAQSKVEALALRVVADRIEVDRSTPEQVRFAVA
jgi:predicted RNase H-like HicB family nuclease